MAVTFAREMHVCAPHQAVYSIWDGDSEITFTSGPVCTHPATESAIKLISRAAFYVGCISLVRRYIFLTGTRVPNTAILCLRSTHCGLSRLNFE